MPAVNAEELINAVLDAFIDAGFPGVLLSPIRRHPRRFAIQMPNGNIEVWVYIWTLTHGGRPSLPNEYRIQMTTVESPLDINPTGYTVLLGYDPNIKVFAGFDLRKHQRFTSGSPSVQIDISCLHKALQNGLAFDRKDNNEIAVGIRSDQLISYIVNADSLHRMGSSAEMYKLLSIASTQEVLNQEIINILPQERRTIIATVRRLSRAANFKRKVIAAYDNRCSVTRIQLRLIDAAHIVPVEISGSSDEIQNGIALSPTYHRAFDQGLIYLDNELFMKINPAKELQLRTLHLDGGINDFSNFLNKKVHLPFDRKQWPRLDMIRRANNIRRIST